MQAEAGLIDRLYRIADAVVIEVAAELAEEQLKAFVSDNLRWLARIAKEAERRYTIVLHPDQKIKPRRIPASMAEPSEYEPIITPSLIGNLPLVPGTRRALDQIMESPDRMWFLHRVSPDFDSMTQIAISEAARSLIVGATVQQAIGRKRSDYMVGEDLQRMQQAFRDSTKLEFDFKIFSPVTRGDWRRVWYTYEIVGELPNGDLLQLGRCDGVQAIDAPALAR